MAALSAFFQALLKMSYAGGMVIAVVVLLRLCLTRLPKKYRFLLWAAVFLRLVCPVFPQSQISVIPQRVTQFQLEERVSVSPDAFTPAEQTPSTPSASPGPSASDPAGPQAPQAESPSAPVWNPPAPPEAPAAPAQSQARDFLQTGYAALLWLIGCNAILLYMVVTYLRLRRSLSTAWRAEDGVWESETIPGPFLLGILRPRIYLPCGLDPQTREIVLLHERAHLARRDHLVKPLACLLLALHWFNPLVWAAFRLMSRDMEYACDERVLSQLGERSKTDYSACLLSFAAPVPRFAGSPLAFGESSAKGRIRNVLNYKKPAFWLVLLAIAALAAVLAVLLTDPVTEQPGASGLDAARLTDAIPVETDLYAPFVQLEPGEESAVPLAARGGRLLLTACAPLPQDSPYYAESGYLDRSTRLILWEAGDTGGVTLLEPQDDELFVWGQLTQDGVVVGSLCWWAQDESGMYQYAVRRYSFTEDRTGLDLSWEQTGPCSRFEVPEPVLLEDGTVLYRSPELSEEDRQTIFLVSPEGAVSAYELPDGEFVRPAVSAAGTRFLFQTTRLEGDRSVNGALYVGASDGSITRLEPELEGTITTALLGGRILCLSYESLPLTSSTFPALQSLSILDLNGEAVTGLDLTGTFSGRHFSQAVTAGGQTALLRDLDGRWVLLCVDEEAGVSLQALDAPADYCTPLYAGGDRYLLWYDRLAQEPGVRSISVTPPAPWLGQEAALEGMDDATPLTRAAELAAGHYLDRLAAYWGELGEPLDEDARYVDVGAVYTEGAGCTAFADVGFQRGGRSRSYGLDFHVYPDGNGGWAYTPAAAAPKTGSLLTGFADTGLEPLAETAFSAYIRTLAGPDQPPADRLWFCTPRDWRVLAGDEADLALAVSYYAVPGDGYEAAKTRLDAGYDQVERSAFLRVTRLDSGDYAITAAQNEDEAVRGLAPVDGPSDTVSSDLWWPGKELTLEDLNGAPEYRQAFLYAPTLSVIARVPEQDITLYTVPWLDGTPMICLRQGGRFQLFAQEWGEVRSARPTPVSADWDGDGTQELAVTYLTGWGTGVSCDELHIYEPTPEGWLDVPLDNGIPTNAVNAALAFSISDGGHVLNLTCGEDAWRLQSDKYTYSGVIFPGTILGLSAEDGKLSYTLGGGTCSDALPDASSLYVDYFTARGTLTYDGTGFSVDSVALAQDIL